MRLILVIYETSPVEMNYVSLFSCSIWRCTIDLLVVFWEYTVFGKESLLLRCSCFLKKDVMFYLWFLLDHLIFQIGQCVTFHIQLMAGPGGLQLVITRFARISRLLFLCLCCFQFLTAFYILLLVQKAHLLNPLSGSRCFPRHHKLGDFGCQPLKLQRDLVATPILKSCKRPLTPTLTFLIEFGQIGKLILAESGGTCPFQSAMWIRHRVAAQPWGDWRASPHSCLQDRC